MVVPCLFLSTYFSRVFFDNYERRSEATEMKLIVLLHCVRYVTTSQVNKYLDIASFSFSSGAEPPLTFRHHTSYM